MKIICVGRNYTAHINELENERPEEPVVFIKPDSSVLPKQQDFYIPEFSNDVHYEVEVLVKIKKVGKHISKEFAPTYYDEIGLGIDFTARDLQSKLKEKGLPWEKAKGFDGAAYVSTFFMLKKGDIIFTGTPAGVGKISPNDYLSGSLEDKELFTLKIK